MIQNSKFEIRLNDKDFDPNNPLIRHLRKFSNLGADRDIIFALCCIFAVTNAVHQKMIEVKRQLADRKRRWTKEFRGLCTSHPGGKLRLTEVARLYTDRVISLTADTLRAKGFIDSTAEISVADLTSIKQQALEPFANMQGFSEDWDAAINGTGPVAFNLLAAVGFAKVTPEVGEWVKKLASYFWPSVFQNMGTKRRDDAGTMFLLFVTEHLRKTTKTKKPHFKLAFDLMRKLQPKQSRRIRYGRQSATSRVNKLKKQWP